MKIVFIMVSCLILIRFFYYLFFITSRGSKQMAAILDQKNYLEELNRHLRLDAWQFHMATRQNEQIHRKSHAQKKTHTVLR